MEIADLQNGEAVEGRRQVRRSDAVVPQLDLRRIA